MSESNGKSQYPPLPLQLCTERPWCRLEAGHEGECVEPAKNTENELPDWDKKTHDPRGWANRKRHR